MSRQVCFDVHFSKRFGDCARMCLDSSADQNLIKKLPALARIPKHCLLKISKIRKNPQKSVTSCLLHLWVFDDPPDGTPGLSPGLASFVSELAKMLNSDEILAEWWLENKNGFFMQLGPFIKNI